MSSNRYRKIHARAVGDDIENENPLLEQENEDNERGLMDMNRCDIAAKTCFVLFFMLVLLSSAGAMYKSSALSRNLDVYRYQLDFVSGNEVHDNPTGGDADVVGRGHITFDSHSKVLKWKFNIDDLDTDVTSIDIMGPTENMNSILTNNVFKSLTTTSTDNTNFEDRIELSNSKAKRLAGEPWRYYILVRTLSHPEGATRSNLSYFFKNV